MDASGAIMEGLSSNFFAVLNGTLYTAGEGVLAGTVREVALAVARREGVPVSLTPPHLEDLPAWEGCFITSTSRLLLPVDEATVLAEPRTASESRASSEAGSSEGSPSPGGAGSSASGSRSPPAAPPPTRRFERGGLVGRLERLVLADVEACSEPLFD